MANIQGQMPPTAVSTVSTKQFNNKDIISKLPAEIQIKIYEQLGLFHAIPFSLTSKLWYAVHRQLAKGIKYRKVALSFWWQCGWCDVCGGGPCNLANHLKQWFAADMTYCPRCDKYFKSGTHQGGIWGCGARDYTGMINCHDPEEEIEEAEIWEEIQQEVNEDGW